MNKVLIIDDDKELCALIKRSVLSEDIEADFCNMGKEGLQKLKEREYQLVILDVMMPGMDGFETLEEIRKESSLPILMFTSKNDSASKVRGLRAGADDYLTKPFSVLELAARIRSLLRRSKKDERLIQIHGLCIDLDKRTVTIHEEPIELTFKEFELLKYLAKNEGRAVSREELINQIWGYDFIGESRTLDVHINSLRKKMGNEYAHWIQSVRQVGYRFVAEDHNA